MKAYYHKYYRDYSKIENNAMSSVKKQKADNDLLDVSKFLMYDDPFVVNIKVRLDFESEQRKQNITI